MCVLLLLRLAVAAHVGHNVIANANNNYGMDVVPWAGGEKALEAGADATIKKVVQE